MAKEKKEKNEAAVALARLRSERLTPERRREIAIKAGKARAAALTSDRRTLIAKWGAICRWRKAKRKAAAVPAE